MVQMVQWFEHYKMEHIRLPKDYTIWHKIFNVFDHEMKNPQGLMG